MSIQAYIDEAGDLHVYDDQGSLVADGVKAHPADILAALAEAGVLEVERYSGALGRSTRYVSPWKEAQ